MPALAALLTALGAVPAGSARASSLAASLPPELTAEGLPRGDWQIQEGNLVQGRRRITYALYVDQRYPSLYRVSRYRITSVAVAADRSEVRREEPEVLIWNVHPGTREILRGFVLITSGADSGHWRSLTAGSAEYREAMEDVLAVYFGHNAAQRR